MKFAATGSVLLCLIALIPQRPAFAETRYVSDVLVIDLREEPIASSPATHYLRTGDTMEVLGEKGNFIEVRTGDGTVGWVYRQYTTAELPKAQVIARLKTEVSRLKKRALEAEDRSTRFEAESEAAKESQLESSKALQTALAEARAQAAEAQKQLEELRRKYEKLVETTKDIVKTTQERDQLRAEHRRMTETIKDLQQERDEKIRSYAIQWFLAGAGVLLVGWLLGASFRRRKKSGYSIG